jgi:intein-encoded DNA endonuclease-like protein
MGTIRTLSETQLKNRREKYEAIVNNNIRNSHVDVNTPELAYLFGILWGDGSIYNSNFPTKNKYIYIGINESDFLDIKYLFKENWRINSRMRKNRSKFITEAVNFDVNLSSFLYKNDYSEKSLKSPSKILSHIPKNLKHYFWRGYSDADGCFYISKNKKVFQYALAGSYDQDWSDFENLLKLLNIQYTVKKSFLKNSKYSVVRFCKKADFIKFGEYIYQGTEIGLSRKFDKVIEAKANVHQCQHSEK